MENLTTFPVTLKKYRSDLTGKTYEGTFTFRRPNLGDQGAISAAMSRMNQGEPFSSTNHEAMFLGIATMSVTLEKDSKPDWWDGVFDQTQPLDNRFIMYLWRTVVEARDETLPFRSRNGEAEEASDESTGDTPA